MKNLALKRLIYGLNNTIVIEATHPKEIIKEIELIKSSMTIEGFIFRPNFANTTELTDYTDEDWNAMTAQYALSYNWPSTYMNLTGERPEEVLNTYFSDMNNILTPSPATSIGKAFNVESTEFFTKVLTDIAQSKIVLRSHQKEIIELMPIEIINAVSLNTVFTIFETQVLFLKRQAEAGNDISSHFTSPSAIVKLVVALYPKNTEPYTGQITNDILAGINVKIPTSIRKKIVRAIQKMDHSEATRNMKKNKNFWKRLFKQLAWQSEEKMIATGQYSNYLDIKGIVFNETITTINTSIQYHRNNGNLHFALVNESYNPGQMMRNLLSYLRYPVGSMYASRTQNMSENFKVADYFEQQPSPIVVKTDVTEILTSQGFKETLLKVNPKLLWQVLIMLEDPKWHKPITSRKVYKSKVSYTRPLPALDPTMTAIAKKTIKKAIKKIKKEVNKSLGKVFIDKSLKNYALQFSGRTETSVSLSGEYLSPGSKIDLTELYIKEILKRQECIV